MAAFYHWFYSYAVSWLDRNHSNVLLVLSTPEISDGVDISDLSYQFYLDFISVHSNKVISMIAYFSLPVSLFPQIFLI